MNFKALITDFRFWLLFFFIARLPSLNMPCIDSYSWRQADGYSIARNFLEEENNVLYPRVDNRQNKSGITGSEFPLLNFLTAQLYKITGETFYGGRLINLLITSLGLFFFYRLLEKYIFKELAFYASMVLLVSIWFSFSKKFTPDTFSCSLVFIGIYQAYSYFENRHWWRYISAIFLIALGLLCKLPAFVILAFLAPLGMKLLRSKRQILPFILLGILSSIPALWWYFMWVPHLNSTYGISYFFMGKGFMESLSGIWLEKAKFFKRFYQSSFFYVAFICFLFGVFQFIKLKPKSLKALFYSGLALSILFIIKSGTNFTEHTYYVIPLVPLMCLVVAYGILYCSKNRVIHYVLLSLIVIECLANQLSVWKVKNNEKHFLELAALADELCTAEELVLTNGSLNPLALYMIDRKGSSLYAEDFTDKKRLEYHLAYSNHILWSKHQPLPELLNNFTRIKETDYWILLEEK